MLLANAVQLGRFLSDGASDALVKSVRQPAWTEWGESPPRENP